MIVLVTDKHIFIASSKEKTRYNIWYFTVTLLTICNAHNIKYIFEINTATFECNIIFIIC